MWVLLILIALVLSVVFPPVGIALVFMGVAAFVFMTAVEMVSMAGQIVLHAKHSLRNYWRKNKS